MDLINKKYEKLLDSIYRSVNNIRKGNLRGAIGDVHYILDNAKEIEMILKAMQLEEENT